MDKDIRSRYLMKMISNVHTHTTWCDGVDTTRSMVERALKLGFTDLGFSSHSSTPFDVDCPGLSDEQAYINDIRSLGMSYSGRINILCGLELDSCSEKPTGTYDYIIGGCHEVCTPNQELFILDDTPARIRAGIERFYSGDAMGMVRDYYAQFADFIRKAKPDIVAHFDLVVKYNRGSRFFDEDSPEYRELALATLDDILDAVESYGGMIEVNTGAMARGVRDEPYPAPFLLRKLADRNTRMIITSDAHRADLLSFGFDMACRLLLDCGFKSMVVLRDGRFIYVPIQ